MSRLPTPGADVVDDPRAAEAWVAEHLGDLTLEGADGVTASPAFRGGQRAAAAALAGLDVQGYAATRNEVWPPGRRGASRLSPYLRHGLLDLPTVWRHVAESPGRDRTKYRDELMWAEYARHVYARVGPALAEPLRYQPPEPDGWEWDHPWSPDMLCMSTTTDELHRDGWLVNQTRMWLASQWTVRAGWDWRRGEDEFYRHLLDGSRASNRVGWQWTVGTGNGKAYGFSRWQVRKRAPGLCERCPLASACPVEDWPAERSGRRLDTEAPGLRAREVPGLAGPSEVESLDEPDSVWLTFESLGEADPALAAHPDLPVVVVFDEPLLARLRLSGKRLVFLAETIADLARDRDVSVHRGTVGGALAGRRPAVTHAPVPGFATRSRGVDVVELHPWRWLVRPRGGPAQSFSAWRKLVDRR